MGDENHLPAGPADSQRVDQSLGPVLSGIQIDHQHRPALLERFLQFQRQRIFFCRDRHQPHRPALLAKAIAQADRPPADRMHQLLENQMSGLGIRQRPVGGDLLDPQPQGQPTQTVPASPEAPAGDPHRVQHMHTGAEHGCQFLPAAAIFPVDERQIKADVMTQDHCAAEQRGDAVQLIDKPRLPDQHRRGDAGQCCDARAEPPLGIVQLLVLSDLFSAFDADDSQFDDAMAIVGRCAGGFDIDHRDGDLVERL